MRKAVINKRIIVYLIAGGVLKRMFGQLATTQLQKRKLY